MSQYIVDKRDLQFVLYEQLDLEALTKLPKYSDFGREDFDIILDEAIKLAVEVIAPLNRTGDEEGCHFEEGKVTTPPGFTAAYKQFCEAGWLAPHSDPDHGGQGVPLALTTALLEIFIGANSSFMFLPGLTAAAAHVIEEFGSEKQQELFLGRMYSGKWTGTMCLTEPQAGTAVGDLTTSATPVEGADYFLISGNKLFISAGDHDSAENIIHLVLARVPGDPEGTKGLSLFIVPKLRVDDDGSLSGPNDVVTTGIEHKMGINASPTCSLTFGDEEDCRGYLLGERRMGIVYMFQMMNEARIICGVQGSSMGNAAYQQALAYAAERIQGTKVTDRRPDAPRVAIIEHPDVRRNLMIMKTLSEGIRALLFHTAHYADLAENAEDEASRTKYQDMLELLTPICKAYATDQGFVVTERAIQVFGGYGYIREYQVEQYLRDVKIASIYEGTNGIQALDLLGRKMRLKGGGLFMTWLQDVNAFLQTHKDHADLADLVAAVDKAKNTLGGLAFAFPTMGKADPEAVLLQATPFLETFGHVEVARLLLEQAILAQAALKERYAEAGADSPEARRQVLVNDREARFYDGKIKGAQFFIRNVLPHAVAMAKSMQLGDRSPLDIVF